MQSRTEPPTCLKMVDLGWLTGWLTGWLADSPLLACLLVLPLSHVRCQANTNMHLRYKRGVQLGLVLKTMQCKKRRPFAIAGQNSSAAWWCESCSTSSKKQRSWSALLHTIAIRVRVQC